MSFRNIAVIALAGLVLQAMSPAARAQTSDVSANSKVPFEFVAADKTFPAGEYRVVQQRHSMPVLRLQSADGKLHTALSYVTRLARQHEGDAPKASFVFDKVGDKHYLSEVWLPGEDGYLLRDTKEEHGHDVLNVK